MQIVNAQITYIDTTKTTLKVLANVATETGYESGAFLVKDQFADEIQMPEYRTHFHEFTVESGWILGLRNI